jgi:cell wall-associated NlpC family hydrolase
MKDLLKKIILISLVALSVGACQNSGKENKSLIDSQGIIAEVSKEYAPDIRVALFNVKAEENEGKLVLKGESNLPEAVNSLKLKLEEKQIAFTDSIKLLPGEAMKETQNALVKISVANLRSNPAHSAELATQATMGTPLKIFKKEGSWYLVQTPDKYLAWVDDGGLEPVTDEKFETWRATPKLIYTKAFGFSYNEARLDSQEVSDLVAGSILELIGEQNQFYEVRYPNGDKAFVEKIAAQPYRDWIAALNTSEENLIKTSKSLMGLPYLWGGTSSKGVDCSGYTKTIYFLNGIIIPRDASQQVHTGKLVDSTKNFENLIPGDLLFFGRAATDSTAERVVHVGMWIGNNQFIHSSGNVHISTFDTTATDFDEANYNRYLRTKRIKDQDGEGLLFLKKEDIFMNKVNEGEMNIE